MDRGLFGCYGEHDRNFKSEQPPLELSLVIPAAHLVIAGSQFIPGSSRIYKYSRTTSCYRY